MSTKRYFFMDQEGDGMAVFHTAAERDEAVKMEVEACNDGDGWTQGVGDIVSGYITHTCVQSNKILRPPLLSINEGAEIDGIWWAKGIDYYCDFKMQAIDDENIINA